MEKTLVVMAAGMGSRFGGLKQIEPVGPSGEFIIDYSVYDAKLAGFSKVVFVIKKELESVFKETIGKRLEGVIDVSYAFQEKEDIPNKKYLAEQREKPWGTIQAVLVAKDYTPGDFAVINADDFYGRDAFVKASEFLDNNKYDNEYAVIGYKYGETCSKFGSVKRGVCFTAGDIVTDLVESKITRNDEDVLCEPLNGSESFKIGLEQPVSMNMFAFKHNFFDYLEKTFDNFFLQSDEEILKSEALLPDLVKEKLSNGEIILHNVTTTSKWLGMTYKEDLDEVKGSINELIEKGEYPVNLWN